MSPETTKLEADKSSGKMIWTNYVRLQGRSRRKYCVQTREEIDQKFIAAGWVIQDKKRLNLYESLGVAVREMDTDTGPADYMLFIDGKACGIIEAKREGRNLGGVAEQSLRYTTSTLRHIQRVAANDQPLPFLYEATNIEIRFRDERDPKPRSCYLFYFHQPQTLKNWLERGRSFRDRLLDLPELNTTSLRDCQVEAITGIENSLKQAKPRALLQMATGTDYEQMKGCGKIINSYNKSNNTKVAA